MPKYDSQYDRNAMTYEQKVELYDSQFRTGWVPARAGQPICVARMAIRDLTHEATRLGMLRQQAKAFGDYVPERLEWDIEATHYCVQLIQDLIEISIDMELNASVRQAQSFSALTLKAALSGAFTDKD